ncbi:AlbA family DNA-binding domain-containing protein [Nocardia takedensis]|uniref:AlbA family DNA-binding domain-containing protein n=1 Tax=Nocardia takedensis TaxID=259390 RepID=UPI003F75F7EF
MDEATLQQLLAEGEGQSTEFKETTSTAAAAIRSLAAFASQPEGGTVVFGVKNDGTPHRAFNIGAETSAKSS